MDIKKTTGEIQKFSKTKLCDSIVRAGAPKNLATNICSNIGEKIKPGATSSNIFREALRYLVKEDLDIALRYSLKRGVNGLGPAGFLFEQYVEAILRAHDFKTKRNRYLKGKCISHEIDIVSEKGKNSYLVEVKYRNDDSTKTHIDAVMYAEARVKDIRVGKKAGNKNFKPWLITNTKFTSNALDYGKCYNIKMTGWNFPDTNCLENLIVAKKVYPVTVLPSITKNALDQFAKLGMILAQDLLPYSEKDFIKLFGISPKIAKSLYKEVQEITN